MGFSLHPRLQQDCIELGRFSLCRVLLLNDARYPWCILVPEREGVREIHDLEVEDQHQLLTESVQLSRFLAETFQADKMNVAALGNLVPQLHLHHIVRYRTDAAWPGPVWGALPPEPYDDEALAGMREKLAPLFRLSRGE